jgi:hypothetical protein
MPDLDARRRMAIAFQMDPQFNGEWYVLRIIKDIYEGKVTYDSNTRRLALTP